ncbi:MAG: hypothetical protein WD535_05770 [Thermaerobacterales bacterium]
MKGSLQSMYAKAQDKLFAGWGAQTRAADSSTHGAGSGNGHAAYADAADSSAASDDAIAQRLKGVVDEVLAARAQLQERLYSEKRQVHEVRGLVDEANDRKARAEKELAGRDEKIKKLEDALTDSTLKYEQLSEDYSELEEILQISMADLRGELETAKRKYENVVNDYEQYRSDKERELSRMRVELAEERALQEQASENHDRLRHENQELAGQIIKFAEDALKKGLIHQEAAELRHTAASRAEQAGTPVPNNQTAT